MSETSSCRDIRAGMEAYVMGELAASEDQFAEHLMGCTACAAEAGLAERVEAELATLPAFDAPPDLIRRIKARVREERPEKVVSITTRRPRLTPFLRPVALAAMLLTALALSFWRSNSSPVTPTALEIAQAEQEARYALALVGRLGRKASAELRDEVFIDRIAVPVGRSLRRATSARPVKPGGLES